MYSANDTPEYNVDDTTDVQNSKLAENNGTVNQLGEQVKDNNDIQSVTMKNKTFPEPETEPTNTPTTDRDHINIEGVVRNSSNTDGLSNESSNESNASLINQNTTQNTNINKVFDVYKSNTDTHKESQLEDANGIEPNSNTIDNNLLHPRWNANSKTANERRAPVTVNFRTEVSMNITNSNRSVATKDQAQMRSNGKDKMRRREEVSLAVSLIVVVLLFVICWLPYCVSMLISIYYHGYVPREFHMFTLLMGYANSGCNPIIYGIMNKRFKLEYKKLFCFWKAHTFTLSGFSS